MSHHGRHVRGLSRRCRPPLKRYLWDKVFLKEEPVTHFVVLPNLQEDEGMLRETLVNLSRSPFGREIHAHCVSHGSTRGSQHFKTKPRVSWRDEIDFAVSQGLEGYESRPTTLWGKSLFEVAESVIGRPKDTSSWTGSESECRDAVCDGVFRNSTFIP